MAVRIMTDDSADAARPETDYLHVRTCKSPDDDTVTLATIQRYIDKGASIDTCGTAWKIKTLVANQPMSPDEAIGFATRYAERKQIPLVVTDKTSSSCADSARRRRRTGRLQELARPVRTGC